MLGEFPGGVGCIYFPWVFMSHGIYQLSLFFCLELNRISSVSDSLV